MSDDTYKTGVRGKLMISGSFQFRDKDGKVIQEMTILPGSGIPLDRFTPQEQQQLIERYGNGSDNR